MVQQRGKEEVPFLKTLMGNDAMLQQVWFGRPNGQAEMHSCLMKDAALAYLISQSGGNIRPRRSQMFGRLVTNSPMTSLAT